MLVPFEPWGSWREELNLDGKYGGMTSVRMSQLRPAGRHLGGQINITVEPSARVGEGGMGVYVRVNDHFATDKEGADSAEHLMNILGAEFASSKERSDAIIDHLMSLAERGG